VVLASSASGIARAHFAGYDSGTFA